MVETATEEAGIVTTTDGEDLTLEEKKTLILEALAQVDNVTITMYNPNLTTGASLEYIENWETKEYKEYLMKKLGEIEYKLNNTEDGNDTSNETEEEE